MFGLLTLPHASGTLHICQLSAIEGQRALPSVVIAEAIAIERLGYYG